MYTFYFKYIEGLHLKLCKEKIFKKFLNFWHTCASFSNICCLTLLLPELSDWNLSDYSG